MNNRTFQPVGIRVSIRHFTGSKSRVVGKILVCLILSLLALSAHPQTLQTLHSFQGDDGSEPVGGLTQGTDGYFYGTTWSGGQSNLGTVFKISPAGAHTTLVSFAGSNGSYPSAGLVLAQDGNLYGTTSGLLPGWPYFADGTVFKITPAGTLTTLVTFTNDGGSRPGGELIQGSDGSFYGTTFAGTVPGDLGMIFKITPTGVFTSLLSFYGSEGPLIEGVDGKLYGTTSGDGDYGDGSLFTATTNGDYSTLASFRYGFPPNFLPAQPQAGLVSGNDGDFYGTAAIGGPDDSGAVFKVTPDGAKSTVAMFRGTNGMGPLGELLLASDGNFYGTTAFGGEGWDFWSDLRFGTVFKLANGALTALVSFADTNGANPEAKLVQGSDGHLYGTTKAGGQHGLGTVFRILMPGATVPVSLSATPSANQLMLSWPAAAAGYHLEESTNVALADSWFPVAQSTVTNAGQISVTVPATTGSKFFRLKSP